MADIVPSLFGLTPGMYQQAQQQRGDEMALQYAKLDPFQQANYAIGRGAYGLAGAAGGLLGGQDPELQRITARQRIASQLNPNDLSTFEKAFNALAPTDPQGAMMVRAELEKVQMGRAKLASENALTGQREAAAVASGAAAQQSAAQTSKIELSVEQETKLRNELNKLPATATEADIRGVLIKYGNPDKVIVALTSAAKSEADKVIRLEKIEADKIALQDKLELREQLANAQLEFQKQALQDRLDLQKQLAQDKIDAQVAAAKDRGATAKEMAAIAQQGKVEIAKIMIQGKTDMATLAASLKQNAQTGKPLSAILQKEEGADLVAIDSLTAQQEALKPAIANLTLNAQGVRKLELGPVNNLKYAALNAAGRSTPESRAFESLKSAVDTARNLQVSAEKGVQTDKDVVRFSQALIAAYGRNDSQATFEALTRYRDAIAKSTDRTQTRLESRRKSQNVEPYGFKTGAALGTPENPIKLD